MKRIYSTMTFLALVLSASAYDHEFLNEPYALENIDGNFIDIPKQTLIHAGVGATVTVAYELTNNENNYHWYKLSYEWWREIIPGFNPNTSWGNMDVVESGSYSFEFTNDCISLLEETNDDNMHINGEGLKITSVTVSLPDSEELISENGAINNELINSWMPWDGVQLSREKILNYTHAGNKLVISYTVNPQILDAAFAITCHKSVVPGFDGVMPHEVNMSTDNGNETYIISKRPVTTDGNYELRVSDKLLSHLGDPEKHCWSNVHILGHGVTITKVEIVRADNISTGINNVYENVETDTDIEYYNLQGIRVENPGRGLYIRRQGSKITKILIR